MLWPVTAVGRAARVAAAGGPALSAASLALAGEWGAAQWLALVCQCGMRPP